ncbi:type III restriction endonuclease subunit R [Heliorestis acidaminivorans]|uniref:Type III restriction endonuclease subunit R n=1 Tax=Heliorestis acidaminivorans TaxID=553427 RepID=A0A6I0F4M2_9FIRM|nr:DEAD/DEAH box helicase family protein [Heliorestis acidaminivorans]KAB2952160.1 type III restriction endonuclease subunit R [Heliorestis acidaminivorans]
MNKTSTMIKNRLSLRQPQTESLEILEYLSDQLSLEKEVDLLVELEKVKSKFPTCIDFERNFPSICFALATGVGKTRLMGAFISYLYIEKRIKNFFVLAPNLTVYNKLIDDLSNVTSPKYVFKGIANFVHNPPVIITGDNYEEFRQQKLFHSEVRINIFNISKINRDTQKSRRKDEEHLPPKIKRLSEYLGESYFNYLASLPDLVLLMDESHHYRADRGMAVLNELKPILGLELTATPQVEQGSNTIKFKNVVYEYSLARAIDDGFVKIPAVATRKDFDPSIFSQEELDKIKLEDGLRVHEEIKVQLEIYSRDTKNKKVKPFVLVVAKDTEHAGKLKDLIQSNEFFDGKYKDKVLEVHSNQSGAEKDENIEQLLSLENPENDIEIVIHVNMLKEGWDVTNLYTIVPLRTAASTTLREQTIGRGLRLPYGVRTGINEIDKLTIISHDRFQEIVDEANKPESIIKRQNIIFLEDEDTDKPKTIVTSQNAVQQQIEEREKELEDIKDPNDKQKLIIGIKADKEIIKTVNDLSKVVKKAKDLQSKETKEIAISNLKESLLADPQQKIFVEEIIEQVKERYDKIVESMLQNTIEIPRIIIQPTDNIKYWFDDFDLDTKNLNYQPSSETIMIRTLTDGKIEFLDSHRGKVKYDSLDKVIVSELMNFPEVEYEKTADLLFKLANQAIDKFKTYLTDENDITNVVVTKKTEIGRYIYAQMKENFHYDIPDYEEPKVYAYTEIKEHNLSKYEEDDIFDYKQTITPTSDIRKKVFTGFKKACHNLYKFDSKTEKDMAIILEDDDSVLKWLRPATGQFRIYWDYNSREYLPDFVVETTDAIYIIETKKRNDVDTREVRSKAKAALEYCKYATEFTVKNEGKPWKYVLIPHDVVKVNMTFNFLVEKYEINDLKSIESE